MDRQRKKRGNTILRFFRQEIIQDYLSSRKSTYMLIIEHGIEQKNVNKMVSRYKQKNLFTFEYQLSTPSMGRKKKSTDEDLDLKLENQEFKRQLQLALLKLEGYQIIGDILEDEYRIDLLKKF